MAVYFDFLLICWQIIPQRRINFKNPWNEQQSTGERTAFDNLIRGPSEWNWSEYCCFFSVVETRWKNNNIIHLTNMYTEKYCVATSVVARENWRNSISLNVDVHEIWNIWKLFCANFVKKCRNLINHKMCGLKLSREIKQKSRETSDQQNEEKKHSRIERRKNFVR